MNEFDRNLQKYVGNPYNGTKVVLPPDSEMSDQTEYDVLITRPVCSSTGVPVPDQRDESTPDQQPPWRG